MPVDLKVIGTELAPMDFTYTTKDAILYALGVGAGYEADELNFVYENGLEVLPTFGVVPPFPSMFGLVTVEGVDINLVMMVHGEQYLELRKPIPVQGTLTSKPVVANVYDKTKGILIDLEVETVDESGEVGFFNRFGTFIRGEGGYGGERGPEPGNEPPDRAPDTAGEMRAAA